MNGYYKLATEILKEHGFQYLRAGKGSHEMWSNGRTTLTVPYNCYSRYTANAIMKDASISHKF